MKRAYECVEAEGGPVTGWVIHCPACGCGHKFDNAAWSGSRPGARWTMTGTLERPTFAPSMLVRHDRGNPHFHVWKAVPLVGEVWRYSKGSYPNDGVCVPVELVGPGCQLTIEAVAAAMKVEPTFEAIKARVRCWRVEKFPPHVCHSFVRDGRIEFLSDCTHALAGQTVELSEP